MNHPVNQRRTLITALGAGALGQVMALPAIAQAQGKPAEKIWRVGYLGTRTRPASIDADFANGFVQGLRERGYVEGRNLVIEWRFAGNDLARVPGLAFDLVQLKPDVIVSGASQGISALQKATSTIPLVMLGINDPTGSGFVASLAHPGGNITGTSNNSTDIAAKQLQVLLEIAPKVKRVAVLLNPDNRSSAAILSTIVTTAQKKAGVIILPFEARTAPAIEPAFALMKQGRAEALMVTGDAMFHGQLPAIAALAIRQRLPSVALIRQYADAGGLMSYGSSFRENFRRAAYYVDRIFRGAKPAGLPVEEPAHFELLINGKTAKALGLKIPQALLIMAEKVIE